MKRALLAIGPAGLWIVFSEFLRNELLFRGHWVDHFRSLGLEFETTPINGAMWMVWSFLFAFLLFKLEQRFSFFETVWVSWLAGFVLMWIAAYNLLVLPLRLLLFAVPLSLLEVLVAVALIRKMSGRKKPL